MPSYKVWIGVILDKCVGMDKYNLWNDNGRPPRAEAIKPGTRILRREASDLIEIIGWLHKTEAGDSTGRRVTFVCRMCLFKLFRTTGCDKNCVIWYSIFYLKYTWRFSYVCTYNVGKGKKMLSGITNFRRPNSVILRHEIQSHLNCIINALTATFMAI